MKLSTVDARCSVILISFSRTSKGIREPISHPQTTESYFKVAPAGYRSKMNAASATSPFPSSFLSKARTDRQQRDLEMELIETKTKLAATRAKLDDLRTYAGNLNAKTDAVLQSQGRLRKHAEQLAVDNENLKKENEEQKIKQKKLEAQNKSLHAEFERALEEIDAFKANSESMDCAKQHVVPDEVAEANKQIRDQLQRKLQEKSSQLLELQLNASQIARDRNQWRTAAERFMCELNTMAREKKEAEKALYRFRHYLHRTNAGYDQQDGDQKEHHHQAVAKPSNFTDTSSDEDHGSDNDDCTNIKRGPSLTQIDGDDAKRPARKMSSDDRKIPAKAKSASAA